MPYLIGDLSDLRLRRDELQSEITRLERIAAARDAAQLRKARANAAAKARILTETKAILDRFGGLTVMAQAELEPLFAGWKITPGL